MILEEEKWPKQFCSRKSWQIEKDRALFPAKRGESWSQSDNFYCDHGKRFKEPAPIMFSFVNRLRWHHGSISETQNSVCFCQFEILGRALNALFSVQISSVLQVEEEFHVFNFRCLQEPTFQYGNCTKPLWKLVVNIWIHIEWRWWKRWSGLVVLMSFDGE